MACRQGDPFRIGAGNADMRAAQVGSNDRHFPPHDLRVKRFAVIMHRAIRLEPRIVINALIHNTEITIKSEQVFVGGVMRLRARSNRLNKIR